MSPTACAERLVSLFNFEEPDRPLCVALAPGQGRRLARTMSASSEQAFKRPTHTPRRRACFPGSTLQRLQRGNAHHLPHREDGAEDTQRKADEQSATRHPERDRRRDETRGGERMDEQLADERAGG